MNDECVRLTSGFDNLVLSHWNDCVLLVLDNGTQLYMKDTAYFVIALASSSLQLHALFGRLTAMHGCEHDYAVRVGVASRGVRPKIRSSAQKSLMSALSEARIGTYGAASVPKETKWKSQAFPQADTNSASVAERAIARASAPCKWMARSCERTGAGLTPMPE
jgi:hypothetical protein